MSKKPSNSAERDDSKASPQSLSLAQDTADESEKDKQLKPLVDMASPLDTMKVGQTRDWLKEAEHLPSLHLADVGETTRKTILIDGVEREYYLHVPKDYSPLNPPPVILALHGYGYNTGQGGSEHGGKGFEQVSDFSKLADQENVIVIYPSGNQEQNFGWNNGQWWFSKLDDVKFIDHLLDKTARDFPLDQSRIYAIGYSQGGSFLHRLIDELPNRFAAAAEVGGWMTGSEDKAAKGLPFMAIQAVVDPTVPPDGRLLGLRMQSEDYTSNYYRSINGITEAPQDAARRVKHHGLVRELTSKIPGQPGEVKLMWLNNEVNHSWYGGLGDKEASINATNETWNFVSRFRKGQSP